MPSPHPFMVIKAMSHRVTFDFISITTVAIALLTGCGEPSEGPVGPTSGVGANATQQPVPVVSKTKSTELEGSKPGDWPQWRGPDRNSISRDTGLLRQWPAGGPPLAWAVQGLGGGDNAPAVAQGKIFGMSNRDGKEIVWAISEANGAEAWITTLGNATRTTTANIELGPACTPTVSGDRLYVLGMGGQLACLSIGNGAIQWQRSLTSGLGGILPQWSYRESPLLDGDRLICTPGGPEAIMAAVDIRNGQTIWTLRSWPDLESSPTSNPQIQANTQPESDVVPRPSVSGTKDPELFLGECFGMTAFSQKVPNGKYLVKLYFAENWPGITKAGQRVFTIDVEGIEIRDFDIWAKSGGFQRAYIESVEVDVRDGELRILFKRKIQNPTISAIEIIPRSGDATGAATIRIKAGRRSKPYRDSNGAEWAPEKGFEGGAQTIGDPAVGGGARPSSVADARANSRLVSRAVPSSAIVIDLGGKRQYVQLTASFLVGVSATHGNLLWKYDVTANGTGIHCSTPIYRDGLIFAASANGNGGAAVRLAIDAFGRIRVDEVYASPNSMKLHGGTMIVDGLVYGATRPERASFLTCMDFRTGNSLWTDRQASMGSFAMADGRLYLRCEVGTMFLIEPSRERLIEHGRFEQPDRSATPAWAHPVIANGKLYLRDQNVLFCYDIKSK